MNLAMTVLVISTVTMFGMVLVFLVAAWWLRRANERKAAKWAALETRWLSLLEAIQAAELAEGDARAGDAGGAAGAGGFPTTADQRQPEESGAAVGWRRT
jgi:hypothetical protein